MMDRRRFLRYGGGDWTLTPDATEKARILAGISNFLTTFDIAAPAICLPDGPDGVAGRVFAGIPCRKVSL